MSLYGVKIEDTTVPVWLTPVLNLESACCGSAGLKNHARLTEPKDRVCLRRNRSPSDPFTSAASEPINIKSRSGGAGINYKYNNDNDQDAHKPQVSSLHRPITMANQTQVIESLTHHEYTSDNISTIKTNRSFVLSPARLFSFEDRPVPELQSSRHVRVRVVATGLCGSDVGARPVDTQERYWLCI